MDLKGENEWERDADIVAHVQATTCEIAEDDAAVNKFAASSSLFAGLCGRKFHHSDYTTHSLR